MLVSLNKALLNPQFFDGEGMLGGGGRLTGPDEGTVTEGT